MGIEFNGVNLLKYRLISVFVLIPIVITALFLLPPIGFSTITLVVCMLAAWEWGRLSCFTSRAQQLWLIVFFGLLVAIMLFGLLKCHHGVYQPMITGLLLASLGWWGIASLLLLFYPDSAMIWRNSKLLRLIFGLFTIVPFFFGTLILRIWHYSDNHCRGALLLLYVMILVWGTDTGGYIFGKLFGKHRLAPKVSSGKTWQGFVGGLLTATIISWIYSVFVNLEAAPITLLICSIFTVLASVLGDLTESMFKREAGIKDSGHLIPGHGGMLDRIDGLMAAVPVFAYLFFSI